MTKKEYCDMCGKGFRSNIYRRGFEWECYCSAECRNASEEEPQHKPGNSYLWDGVAVEVLSLLLEDWADQELRALRGLSR